MATKLMAAKHMTTKPGPRERGPARPRPQAPAGAGVLVAVVGAEGRGKEMLVAIARRRFEMDASLAFPARITTRALAASGGDVAVSRRAFRELAGEGAFCCQWESGGQSFGLARDVARLLAEGCTVVVVVGRDAIDSLRAICPDVRVIEVQAGPDSVPRRLRPGMRGGRDCELRHEGDVATAVAKFHDMIRAMRLERLSEASPSSARGRRPSLARLARGCERTGLRNGRQRA